VRIMIYKRTHTGDPTPEGIFGLSDCMGRVRAREYDAVIGVGGLSAEPQACGIAGRITWVGVGAHRGESIPVGYRGPIVEFDRFKLFDEAGPLLDALAPALAQHLFGVHRRVVMSDGLGETMQHEIARILRLVSGSSIRRPRTTSQKINCAPRRSKAASCPPGKRSRIC
jgi:hypothetical protein